MKSKEEILNEKDLEIWHHDKQVYGAMDEYAEQVAIEFGKWVSHEDWVYLLSKDCWLNEEQEELHQPLNSQQIFQLFQQSLNK